MSGYGRLLQSDAQGQGAHREFLLQQDRDETQAIRMRQGAQAVADPHQIDARERVTGGTAMNDIPGGA